jgi:sugar phosphate isomerase/epimerase
MKTAITLCQVPEALHGPFVLRAPLPEAFAKAAEMGFDAVELFLPGPDFVTAEEILSLSAEHKLAVAAIGTGAGWLRDELSLTSPCIEKRESALQFVLSMIEFGGRVKAPAILGSMQGKSTGPVAIEHLALGLERCSEAAAAFGVPFIFEPLNRYETSLFNRLGDAASFLESYGIKNVLLLADLFHMNIEERDIAAALRESGPHIGHVHFADSNRHAMGFGHTPAEEIIAALREISYKGYLSAEILPLPDPETAARQTLLSIHSLLSK